MFRCAIATADVPAHRGNDVAVVARVRFARRFLAEKQRTDHLISDNERDDEVDAHPAQGCCLNLHERET
jgi:hypothetical protein